MKSIWRFTMSTKEQQVQEMTNKIANFISYMAKVLPDDVQEKIHELAQDEKILWPNLFIKQCNIIWI